MRQLESGREGAFAVADALPGRLLPGERAFSYLSRAAQRRLTIDPAGRKQLVLRPGEFEGYLRLGRADREIYLNALALSADGVGRLLESGRGLLPLGRSGRSEACHVGYQGTWANREGSVGLEDVAADPAPLLGGLAEGAGAGFTVRSLVVSEVLSEQFHADAEGSRGHSMCRGASVTAVVSADEHGISASATRHAADLDRIDAVGLGRELALTAAAFGPPTGEFTGHTVGFLPAAAAQLLRALTTTVLCHPIVRAEPLVTAVLDDGRALDGPSGRAFDCEGTPTTAMELVSRDGEQQAISTRLNSIVGTARQPAPVLTGHAVWEAHRHQPQPAATNVTLAPGGVAPDLWSGEACLVADARSLGEAELRAGGQLAFRLLAVRAVDGRPTGAYAPIVVEGEAMDFLAALTGVGETTSYYDGSFAVGGAPLTMNSARLKKGGRP